MMLKIINSELTKLDIPYEFMRWTSEPVETYFVGSYSEFVTVNEDGLEEYTFTLNGFTTGSYSELEIYKEKIRRAFPSVGGFRAKTENGVFAIFYDTAITIESIEADLKRIQINLTVMKWKDGI